MKLRPDMLDGESPKQIEVVQITTDPEVPASHVYMEAPIFAPDSKRFVLHRSATAHGGSKRDPKHQYLLCDIENGWSLSPLTEELGAVAPAVSPDGRYCYYLVDETEVGGGRLTLKRVNLDGSNRQTLLVLDTPVPETSYRPSRIYPLSTISSEGQRLAAAVFLGDGQAEQAPYGLLVFDLVSPQVRLILQGPTWCNLHPQYCHATGAEASHDLLIQENHGNAHDPQGGITTLISGDGADIHVVRDDGTNLRDLPWGRDGAEFCQGHQCWRGRTPWAITTTYGDAGNHLVEGLPARHVGDIGSKHPDGIRNDFSRNFPEKPGFCHFGCDTAGEYLISDSGPTENGGRIFFAALGEAGRDAARSWRYLLNPRSTWKKESHVHPFLSPDGRRGFFNSDESGVLQAYAVVGLR